MFRALAVTIFTPGFFHIFHFTLQLNITNQNINYLIILQQGQQLHQMGCHVFKDGTIFPILLDTICPILNFFFQFMLAQDLGIWHRGANVEQQ